MRQYLHLFTILSAVKAGEFLLTPNIGCPPNMTLTGKKCVGTVFKPSMPVCMNGELVDGVCLASTPALKHCPEGSTMQGGVCVTQVMSEAVQVCPPGTNLELQQCKAVRPLEIVNTCLKGKLAPNGSCVDIEKVSKLEQIECPPGFYNEGDACTKISEYDCSPEAPPLLTPKIVNKTVTETTKPLLISTRVPVNHYHSNHGHHRGYQTRGGMRYLNSSHRSHGHTHSGHHHSSIVPIKIAPAPVRVEEETIIVKEPVITSNVAVVEQKCRRQDIVAPLLKKFCPAGYDDNGSYCTRSVTYPSERVCINGSSIDKCFKTDIFEPVYVCNMGTLVDGMCITQSQIASESYCPPGSRQEGNKCVFISQPQFVCESGMRLEGTQCIGKEIAEPVGVIETPCVGKQCFTSP